MVRRTLRPACEVQELVIRVSTTTTATTDHRESLFKPSPWESDEIADHLAETAVSALIAEAELPGKPGLVGPDGARAHGDMDVDLMLASARSLRPTFHALAIHGTTLPVGQELRDALGKTGRDGESVMMDVTEGVNTHRGAIWNLGLLVTAAAGLHTEVRIPSLSLSALTGRAGSIASIKDSAIDHGQRPGARARKQYGVGGAVSEAAGGFPHVHAIVSAIQTHLALPAHDAHLLGLLTSMSSLDDTCILHRGGEEALRKVTDGSMRLILDAHRTGRLDRQALEAFDHELSEQQLSPGGSADLLACSLFLIENLNALNDKKE